MYITDRLLDKIPIGSSKEKLPSLCHQIKFDDRLFLRGKNSISISQIVFSFVPNEKQKCTKLFPDQNPAHHLFMVGIEGLVYKGERFFAKLLLDLQWRNADDFHLRSMVANLQEVAVDPGLVLEVIDWLEGVYWWKASVPETQKQVPEVGIDIWIKIECDNIWSKVQLINNGVCRTRKMRFNKSNMINMNTLR